MVCGPPRAASRARSADRREFHSDGNRASLVIAAPENSVKPGLTQSISQRRIACRLSLCRDGARRLYARRMSSIRPWRDIERRKSRQIMVGNVPVGGDAPVTVQTMTNTPTVGRQGDDRPDPPLRGGRRRHHPRVLPRRGSDRGAEGDRPRGAACRSSPTSISTTSARSRRPTPAPPACASTPATSARRSGSSEVIAAAKRQRLRDPHRRQCRQPREGPARKIWRALPRGAGRKRARPYPHPRGP